MALTVHPFLHLSKTAFEVNRALFKMGVNLSGAEYEYPAFPTSAEVSYLNSKNINFIRLPIRWDNMQPVLYAALNPAYLASTLAVISNAVTHGSTVLLDIHNYGGYGPNKLGDGTLAYSAFADLWSRLATVLKGNPGIHGYDLMNEPALMPNAGAWPAAAQAAVDAIRLVDTATTIYIEGDGYAAAGQWTDAWTGSTGGGNKDLNIIDPSNNLVYSAHCYCDYDNSGRYSDYDQQVEWSSYRPDTVAPGTCPNVAVVRMNVFAQWCIARGYRMHIGEFGAPNTDPRWLECFDRGFAFCKANGIEVSAWASGPSWGDGYPFSIEPRSNNVFDAGGDARQMAVLTKYTGAAQPTKYFISNPLRAAANVPADAFVEYRGVSDVPIVITPTDNGAGGTFEPATVTIPAGRNGLAKFKYTAAIAERIFLSSSNDKGLTDPPQALIVTKPDNFMGLSTLGMQIRNIYALHRVYTPYSGYAVRLRRDYDYAEKDFYFELDGSLPRVAIQTWAYDTTAYVVTVYDQSPNARHLTITPPYYPILNLSNAAGYPEITWTYGNRGQFPSPTIGQTEQTLILRASNAGGEGNFMRQDYYAGPMLFGPGTYNVYGQGGVGAVGSTITFAQTGTHNFAATYKSLTTNGQNGYVDGVLKATANTGQFVFSPSNDGMICEMGFFKFYTAANWSGTWQEFFIFDKAMSSAQISTFNTSTNLFYSTPLTPLGANQSVAPGLQVNPTFTGPSQPTKTIAVTTGQWSKYPTGYTYQWYMDGVIVPGETAASYICTTNDLGKMPAVMVTATNSAGSTSTALLPRGKIVSIATEETPLAAPTNFITLRTNYKGVNNSNAEFNANMINPTIYKDYQYPTTGYLDYYASKGFGLIRMPFDMNRVYTAFYEPLNTTEINRIKSIADYLGQKGMHLVLDPHNYGYITTRISLGHYNTGGRPIYESQLIGKVSEATNLFVDFWKRFATVFKNYPNVIFNLMNEPNAQTAVEWHDAAILAINAIRATGATQKIFIPGTLYTGAHSWISSGNAAAWAGFTDINFSYEMHQYLDSDNSGTHAACTLNSGATRLQAATTWARGQGATIHLGEIGWSQDTSCPAEAASAMNYMDANADVWMGWAYWSSGAWNNPSTYMFSIDPIDYANIVDKPQMVELLKHL